MSEEPELVISALAQPILSDGHVIDVHIYKLEGEADWALELEDEHGTSFVWDAGFATESAAFAEAKQTILNEGLSIFTAPEPDKNIK